jgi:hypothetical protein
MVCCALSFAQTNEPAKFNGPGSCASPSCHGGVQIRNETTVQQNEYSIWVVHDRHTRAYNVLSNDVAKNIVKLMGMKSNAQEEPRCLACHSVNPGDRKAATFSDLTDGVSCESCHGPASKWLGPHTEKDWHREDWVEGGKERGEMKDLRDIVKRTENCAECHIGSSTDPLRKVDHELIAAGHPDLVFSLTYYQDAMPKHWREEWEKPEMPGKAKPAADPFFDVRAMAISEATELRLQLQRVARNAQGTQPAAIAGVPAASMPRTVWPEYGDLDCFACHHSLTDAKDSWFLKRGFPPDPDAGGVSATANGRRPGNPPLNISRFVVLKAFLTDTDPGMERDLAGRVDETYRMVTALGGDRAAVARQATETAGKAGDIATMAKAATFDQAKTLRIMKGIVANADYITRQGERPAEQSALALWVLYEAYSKAGKPAGDARIRESIDALRRQVDNPSSYDAFKFANGMKAVGGVLP